jgi:hypothetical protein
MNIDLTREHLKAEKLTNSWLKTNNISEKLFKDENTLKIKAFLAANNTLKHNVNLLKEDEYKLLKNYCDAMINSKQRKNISKQIVYKVMNTNKRIYRKLFKAFKKIRKI